MSEVNPSYLHADTTTSCKQKAFDKGNINPGQRRNHAVIHQPQWSYKQSGYLQENPPPKNKSTFTRLSQGCTYHHRIDNFPDLDLAIQNHWQYFHRYDLTLMDGSPAAHRLLEEIELGYIIISKLVGYTDGNSTWP